MEREILRVQLARGSWLAEDRSRTCHYVPVTCPVDSSDLCEPIYQQSRKHVVRCRVKDSAQIIYCWEDYHRFAGLRVRHTRRRRLQCYRHWTCDMTEQSVSIRILLTSPLNSEPRE